MKPTRSATMSENHSRELLERFLRAQHEDDVAGVIEADPYMSDPRNWALVNGCDMNWSTASNQGSEGPKAAAELIPNMVDAILMRHAIEFGVDPRSDEAPAGMKEAIERWLGWKDGHMMRGIPSKHARTKWASENMVIAFSGLHSQTEPSLTFCDSGEGQHPEDFDRTFLSFKTGYKRNIRFVQGKFNMGSSGAQVYCGDRKYKLIASRKCTQDGKWGWTLLRLKPGTQTDSKNPSLEYFKIGGADGAIPAFAAEQLVPLFTQDGQAYEDIKFAFGTVVKLYNLFIDPKKYDVGSYNLPRQMFVEHLADTMMPVRLLDMRVKPSKNKGKNRALGIDGRTFCGLEHHISSGQSVEDTDGDLAEAVETSCIDVGEIIRPDLGRIAVRAYYSEGHIGSGLIKGSNRVFHSVNGQIHYVQSRGFLSECGYPALKDHAVIVVDATGLKPHVHTEIWKADREKKKSTKLAYRYDQELEEMIRNCEDLKRLNDEIYLKATSRATTNVTQSLFQRMLTRDPGLRRLFVGPTAIPAAARHMARNTGSAVGGSEADPAAQQPPFKGSYSPNFLEVEGGASGIKLPREGTAVVRLRTDAGDDYLSRQKDRGVLSISGELTAAGVSVKRTSLKNGRMMLFLEAAADAPLGEMSVEFILSDPTMGERRVAAMSKITITEAKEAPAEEKDPGEKKPRQPRSSRSNFGEPISMLFTRDGRDVFGEPSFKWDEVGFSEIDGGTSEQAPDGRLILKINVDNENIQQDLRQRANDKVREELWRKYCLAMTIHMSAVEARIDEMKRADEGVDEDSIDHFRRSSAAAFAKVAITICDGLPRAFATSVATADEE